MAHGLSYDLMWIPLTNCENDWHKLAGKSIRLNAFAMNVAKHNSVVGTAGGIAGMPFLSSGLLIGLRLLLIPRVLLLP